jgi:DNA-directed RNA polymerase specialized sigma24 family protein
MVRESLERQADRLLEEFLGNGERTWLTERQLQRRRDRDAQMRDWPPADDDEDPGRATRLERARRVLEMLFQAGKVTQTERIAFLLPAWGLRQDETAFILGSARSTVRRLQVRCREKIDRVKGGISPR